MASADRTCFTELRQSNAHVNVTVPEGHGGDAARENEIMPATPQALPNRAPKRARFDDGLFVQLEGRHIAESKKEPC